MKIPQSSIWACIRNVTCFEKFVESKTDPLKNKLQNLYLLVLERGKFKLREISKH